MPWEEAVVLAHKAGFAQIYRESARFHKRGIRTFFDFADRSATDWRVVMPSDLREMLQASTRQTALVESE